MNVTATDPTPQNTRTLRTFAAVILPILAALALLMMGGSGAKAGMGAMSHHAANPSGTVPVILAPDGDVEEVTIENFRYTPQFLTITVGTTVRWTNLDLDDHTATAYDGSFDTSYISQFNSGDVTFNAAGVFSYYCTPHPYMTGTITVLDPAGGSPTATTTAEATSTATTTPDTSATPTLQTTPSPTSEASPTATTTPGVCSIQFSDVTAANPFYNPIRCLACREIISGYGDGTFRPYANVTRSQVAKISANADADASEIPSDRQTFQDVSPSNTFWLFIERVAARGIISGYTCGTASDIPCVGPGNKPYFRPFNNLTRAQLAKVVAITKGYSDVPTGQTFEDVSPSNPFYSVIEQIAARGIISGYNCGSSPNNPCVSPGNRPYFRPFNDVTRAQTAKIVAAAFYPNCGKE